MRTITAGRQRIALALLVIVTLGLLVGVIASSFYPPPIAPAPSVRAIPPAAQVAQLRYVLFLVVILILLLCVSLLALLRWSRHFRRLILHRPLPPTPADDVWAMHRLKDEEEPEGPADVSGQPEGS